MIVVIEGPDGSGKSTLAEFIAKETGIALIHSGGPQKYDGEINNRIRNFLAMPPPLLFDRFPAVSEQIYAPIIRGSNPVDPDLAALFYDRKPIIIYCRDQRRELRHTAKDRESPEHLAAVEKNHAAICEAYDKWAAQHASITYQIGQDMTAIVRHIQEAR